MSLATTILGVLNKLVKSIAGSFGFVYVGISKIPKDTLLGIRERKIKTIIDIGANTGQFSSYIKEIFPDAQIIAFEPLPNAFNSLDAWAKSLPKNHVKTYNMAIGEKEGSVEMNCHIDFTPSSSLLDSTSNCESTYPITQKQEKVMVPMKTLDSALNDIITEISSGVLVKLDVQGYEDRVISGGKKILTKAEAIILEISFDQLYKSQAKFINIVNMLNDLGFQYSGNLEQAYGKDGHVIYIDAVFIKKH